LLCSLLSFLVSYFLSFLFSIRFGESLAMLYLVNGVSVSESVFQKKCPPKRVHNKSSRSPIISGYVARSLIISG
jgi:hypothetical protein